MINKEMTISEILRRYPETIAIFRRYGIDCFDCQLAEFEALEYGAERHKVNIETLVAELNERSGCYE